MALPPLADASPVQIEVADASVETPLVLSGVAVDTDDATIDTIRAQVGADDAAALVEREAMMRDLEHRAQAIHDTIDALHHAEGATVQYLHSDASDPATVADAEPAADHTS